MDSIKSWLTTIDSELLAVFGTKLGIALLILIVGRWLTKGVLAFITRTMNKRNVDSLLTDFVTRILSIALLVVVVLTAVAYVGIDITPLVVLLGGSALAIGLALQSSLSNFASGMMLVAFRPFTKGHYVEAGGVGGTVTKVSMFNTEMVTPDNRHIIVPNSAITSATITNYSAHDTRRIDLVIGVHYNDDLKVARDTIAGVLQAHSKVLTEPGPQILVMDLADSSVNIAARPWVASADYWAVRSELLEQIKVALETAGCSIPYPQRDFRLHQIIENAEG